MKNKFGLGAMFISAGVLGLTLSASAHAHVNIVPQHAVPVQVQQKMVAVSPFVVVPKAGQALVKMGANGSILVRGTLMSVSGTTLTLNVQGTTFTVDASKAQINNKNVTSVSAFALGDFVGATGTVSLTNPTLVMAKDIKDRSMTQ